MNILVPHSWMKEYVETKMSAKDIARRVAISGPSIERVEKISGEDVYDVEITTNRIDSFSIAGFAREVGVILDTFFRDALDEKYLKKSLNRINKDIVKNRKVDGAPELEVTIEDTELCRRYCGAILEGVKVGPSPKWLSDRLEMCGIRSINNVVDVTNYVMLELGQPMHAFDSMKIAGTDPSRKQIIVRRAQQGEGALTLDGQSKDFTRDMLVVSDTDQVLAIAGVKGGVAAEITSDTTSIILESASFDPVNVRTTSRVLNLRTDASARFEKNLHPEYAIFALARAIELLEECTDARVVSITDEYPTDISRSQYDFSWNTLERMSGIVVDKKEVVRILKSLGFDPKPAEDGLSVTVPFWREFDIEGEADFVEEIIRIHGYEKLPVEPLRGAIPLYNNDNSFIWERETKHFLRDIGWSEVMNYSFISEELLKKASFSIDEALRINNPLSVEFEYMRPSLIPGLLQLASDHEQKRDSVSLFELSKIYTPRKDDLPEEVLYVAGILSKKVDSSELFFEIKGVVESLANLWLGKSAEKVGYELVKEDAGIFSGGHSASVMYMKNNLGTIGIPRQEVLDAFGLRQGVVLFDINFDTALPFMTREKTFTPIAKFPAVLRDVAVVIDKKYSFQDIVRSMKDVSSLVRNVELFDVFSSEKLGLDKHSLAFHITYRSDKKTLSAEEADAIHEELVSRLKADFAVEMR